MKRTIPLIISSLAGIVLIVSNFIPATVSWGEAAAIWFDILAGVAFLLGGANLVRVHLKKVSDKQRGWAYSLIILGTFFLTLGVGLTKLGIAPAENTEFYGETFTHLKFSQLPPELTYRLPTQFDQQFEQLTPEHLPELIPTSCKWQFSMLKDGELQFRGWMLDTQKHDLLGISEVLAWRAAIEKLSALAQPPAELQGKVNYYADHQSLASSGVVSPADEAALKKLSPDQTWAQVVEKLAADSRMVRTVKVAPVPAEFTMPTSLVDRVTVEQGPALKITGPLSQGETTLLAAQFPIVRSATESDIAAIVAELKKFGPLSERQIDFLTKKINSYNWTVEELQESINIAGKPEGGKKTFTQLLEERNAGATELDPTIPPMGDPIVLNPAQVEALKTFASSNMRISTLIDNLKAAGPLSGAQASAVRLFFSLKPTLGIRNREICITLYGLPKEHLTREQIVYLMAPYKQEMAWANSVSQALTITNPPKYSWSGLYDEPGSVFWWIYEYAFRPLQATVFALLAYYVASASFRAFRAKNIEAILLLSTAFLVLLGRTFAGGYLSDMVPPEYAFLRIDHIVDWIMNVPYNAAGRAMMIGIALGVISTSLKILLGMDRSYLGSDD
jgi:hypothetical protein